MGRRNQTFKVLTAHPLPVSRIRYRYVSELAVAWPSGQQSVLWSVQIPLCLLWQGSTGTGYGGVSVRGDQRDPSGGDDTQLGGALRLQGVSN